MRIAVIDPVARDTSEFQIPEISGVEIMRSNLRWERRRLRAAGTMSLRPWCDRCSYQS